jgi:hypothetical protein
LEKILNRNNRSNSENKTKKEEFDDGTWQKIFLGKLFERNFSFCARLLSSI